LPYSLRRLFQLLPARVRDVLEKWELLTLVSWNNVNVQVENLLSRGLPVLLDDSDSVGFRGVFDDD
jgi:hypothetical protein